MRRPREYLGQLELMVLLAVVHPGGEAYGVQISKCIEEASGREVSLASVYAALERLERKGLIKSSLGENLLRNVAGERERILSRRPRGYRKLVPPLERCIDFPAGYRL